MTKSAVMLAAAVLLLALGACRVPAATGEIQQITQAIVLDDTHVLLQFSQPVLAKEPKVFVDGLAIPGAVLPEKKEMLVTLPAPLAQALEVNVTGITPQPLSHPVQPPVWPAIRNNLVFLWVDGKSPNMLYSARTKSPVAVTLAAAGEAKCGALGQMELAGGSFSAALPDASAAGKLLRKSKQFSLELTLAPASLAPETNAVILDAAGNISLLQRGPQIVLEVRTGKRKTEQLPLCTLADAKPAHLLVSYRPGALACYLNGTLVPATGTVAGKPASWQAKQLTFGTRQGAPTPWQGSIAGVALYARVLTADEAAGTAAAYQKYAQAGGATTGQGPKQAVVQLKLLAMTKTPAPEAVLPYRHALISFEYQVVKVASGALPDLKPGAVIRVMRWGILGGKHTKVVESKVGDEQTLTLELFTDHPELERQFTVDQLPENFDLPVFLDMTKL